MMWKNIVQPGKSQIQDGACALHVGYLRLQIHTQSMWYLLLFHCNNGCTNEPHYYVVRIPKIMMQFVINLSSLSQNLVGKSWHGFWLRMEGTVSRHWGYLWIYLKKKRSRHGQTSAGGPPSWVLGGCSQILTIETPCYEIWHVVPTWAHVNT